MARLPATFRLRGAEELSRRIKTLEDDVLAPASRAAGRSAMGIVQKNAIARAGRNDNVHTPTNIADHIGMRTGYNRKAKTMTIRVGVLGEPGTRSSARYRSGDKDKGLVTYWRFVELGTSRSRARPFLRPALANNAAEVMQEFIREMTRQLDRRV